MTVVINGVEYVPRTEAPTAEQVDPTGAARELLMWLYLEDRPYGHVWAALRMLNPVLADLAREHSPQEALQAIRAIE